VIKNEPVIAPLVGGLVFFLIAGVCHLSPPWAKILFPKATYIATRNLYLVMGTLLVLWALYDAGIIPHK
jgi:hypothetical protein